MTEPAPETAGKHPGRILVPLGLMILTLAFAGYLFLERMGSRPAWSVPEELAGVLYPEPKSLAPFTLSFSDGKPFDLDTLKGGWTFLFFGYTHCPDICPMALGVLAEVFGILEKEPGGTGGVRGIFVSVDPERDTPELLAGYVPYFNPAFRGATGPVREIAAFTTQVGAMYILHKKSEQDEGYSVSHTASLFLVDPQGRLVARFSPPHRAPAVVEQFNRVRSHLSQGVSP